MKTTCSLGFLTLRCGLVALGFSVSGCDESALEGSPAPDASAEDSAVEADVTPAGNAADAQGDAGSSSTPPAIDATTDAFDLDAPIADEPESQPDSGLMPDMSAPDMGIDAEGGLEAEAEAGVRTTYSIIEAIGGDDCLACANAQCVAVGADCESVAGTADGGSASGTSRTNLCLDTLTCVLTQKCMEVAADASDPGNGLACYCGDLDYLTCIDAPTQGACRSSEERGVESTDPTTVVQRYTDPTYGAGMANNIGYCLLTSCPSCN